MNETESRASSIDVEATMRLMDVADEVRRRAREDREVLGRLEAMERDKLKEHLITLYEGLDEEVDPALIDDAIDTFIAEQHRFREPPQGFTLTLAQWYVRRAELRRKYGAPALIIATVLTVGWVAADQWSRFQTRRAERRVEIGVEDLHTQWLELGQRTDHLTNEPAIAALPENEQLRFDTLRMQVRADLQLVEPFLQEYAPDGATSEAVTRANYLAVEERSEGIRQNLRAVSERVSEAEEIISFQRSLLEARLRVDELVSEVRTADVPAAPLDRAERAYALARENIERRQLQAASAHEAELSSIAQGVRTLVSLTPRVSQLHESIRAMAVDATAIEQSDSLHGEAGRYIASANVDQLSNVVVRLEALEDTLSLEYRVVIVGGVWRYENNNPGNRNYYLRVRAVAPGRGPIRMSITNEETNARESVLEWGERVPKEVYDTVAADKGDNGLIDDDAFAEKKRGYLTVERRYPDVGQITRW